MRHKWDNFESRPVGRRLSSADWRQVSRHRTARRANAMVLAVSITALLAIIGSAFVLMSRMQRQAVTGVAGEHAADAALEAVLTRIQTVLADDVVDNSGDDVNKLLREDTGIGEKLAYREPYDGTNDNDPWLAAIEPGSGYSWPQVSEIFQDTTSTLTAGIYDPTTEKADDSEADADGDGVTDARWRKLDSLSTDNENIYAAVRIIDNCGMINLNTAWLMEQARPSDANSYGEFLSQINMRKLLSGKGTETQAETAMNELQDYRLSGASLAMDYFNENYIRRLDGLTGQLEIDLDDSGSIEAGELFMPKPFCTSTELELRNRYFINNQSEESPLEAVSNDWQSWLTTPTTHFADVVSWYNNLVPAGNAWPSEIRHLLTSYSWDREIRTYKTGLPTDEVEYMLDAAPGNINGLQIDAANTSQTLGKYRKVNVNDCLRAFVKWYQRLHIGSIPEDELRAKEAALRLANALAAAGYRPEFSGTTDVYPTSDKEYLHLGLQYLANLVDYLDDDDLPTVIKPGSMDVVNPSGGTLPEKMIIGLEPQPFITEVYIEVEDVSNTLEVNSFAVELYNPFSRNIDLSQYVFAVNNNKKAAIPTNTILPAGGRAIFKKDFTLTNPPAGVDVYDYTFDIVGTYTGITELALVRTIGDPYDPAGTDTIDILVDVVRNQNGDDAGNVDQDPWGDQYLIPDVDSMNDGDVISHSIWRSTGGWGFVRNHFNTPKTAHQLGIAAKDDGYPLIEPLHGKDYILLGIPLRFADVVHKTTNPKSPLKDWRVGSWYDLECVPYVGNPEFPVSGESLDKFGRTLTEHAYLEYMNEPGAGTAELATEADVRFDYYVHVGANDSFDQEDALLEKHISLYDRSGNWEDDNADAEGLLDELMETRLPGRININTAPYNVIRAIIPVIHFLSPTEADQYRDELARAIIIDRNSPNGPFKSVADFVDRVKNYQDSTGTINYFWPSRYISAVRGLVDNGVPNVYPQEIWEADTALGYITQIDPQAAPDKLLSTVGSYLDRDMVFMRMANLITVRSDTFTAYIAIRRQNSSNPANYTEQRYIALFDRSNVFLPRNAGRNGPYPYQDTVNAGTYDPMEPFVDDPGSGTIGVHDSGEPFQDLNYASYTQGDYDPGDEWGEAAVDVNSNGKWDYGENLTDMNGNDIRDYDDSGDMIRYDSGDLDNMLDDWQKYGPGGRYEPDHFDAQYTTPRLVAIKPVPEVR